MATVTGTTTSGARDKSKCFYINIRRRGAISQIVRHYHRGWMVAAVRMLTMLHRLNGDGFIVQEQKRNKKKQRD